MKVMINIKGTQTVDGESDVVELTTAGTMEPVPDGWKLCYNESEATGLKDTVTHLTATNERVELERTGTHPSMLVLEKGQRHHCTYNTPYGTLDLGTYASHIQNALHAHGGKLNFSYTLGFNGSVSAEHTIDITVREEQSHVQHH